MLISIFDGAFSALFMVQYDWRMASEGQLAMQQRKHTYN
jgi:hypothetical protein